MQRSCSNTVHPDNSVACVPVPLCHCLGTPSSVSRCVQPRCWLPGSRVCLTRSIHKLGVKHGDLHEGNILVATDGRVMLLDFDNATVEAPAGALEDEDCLLLENLVMKVGWDKVRGSP